MRVHGGAVRGSRTEATRFMALQCVTNETLKAKDYRLKATDFMASQLPFPLEPNHSVRHSSWRRTTEHHGVPSGFGVIALCNRG